MKIQMYIYIYILIIWICQNHMILSSSTCNMEDLVYGIWRTPNIVVYECTFLFYFFDNVYKLGNIKIMKMQFFAIFIQVLDAFIFFILLWDEFIIKSRN